MRFDQRTDNAIKGQGAVPDGRAVCLTHIKIVGGSREKGNGINKGLGKKNRPGGRPWKTTRLERFELPTL